MTGDVYLRRLGSVRQLYRVRIRTKIGCKGQSLCAWKRRTLGTIEMNWCSCFGVPIRVLER